MRTKCETCGTRFCKLCGKPFLPFRSRGWAGALTCSQQCSHQLRKQNNRRHLRERYGKQPLEGRKCGQCGKEFTARSPSGKYCCDDCRSFAHNRKERERYARLRAQRL